MRPSTPASPVRPDRIETASLAATVAWLIGLTVLALALRILHLDKDAIWLDEAFTAWFVDRPWSYLWTEVPKFETHPTLFYSIMKVWQAFGRDEFALRLLPALLSVVTLPMVFASAYIVGGPRRGPVAAILAGLLFACSATQLQAAQDARPYALMTLAMAIITLCIVHIVCHPERANRPLRHLMRRDRVMAASFALLGFGLALMAWSHNLGALFCVSAGLTVAAWWVWRGMPGPLFVNLAISALLALLFYAANLPILAMQMSTMGEHGFWLWAPSLKTLVGALLNMPFGLDLTALGAQSVPARAAQALALAVLGGLGLLALAGRRRQGGRTVPAALVLLALAAFPIALSLVLTYTVRPLFLFRTLQSAQIPLLIVLAFAPFALPRLRHATVALLVVLCLASAVLYHARPERGFWRDVAVAINESGGTERTVPVVVLPNSLGLILDFYADRHGLGDGYLPVPAAFPAIGPQFGYPGGNGAVPGVTRENMAPVLAGLRQAERVWYLARGEEFFDKDRLFRTALTREFPCRVRQIGEGYRRAELLRRADADGSCPTTD